MRGFVVYGVLTLLSSTIVMAEPAGPIGIPLPAGAQSPFDDRSAPSTYQYDTLPAAAAWALGSESLAMTRFDAVGGADLIRSISVQWYIAANGSAARIFVWQDPTGAGNPRAAVLLHEQAVTVQSSGSGTYTVYALPEPIAVRGSFYIGVSTLTPTFTLASQVNPSIPAGRCLIGGTNAPPFDASNLNALPALIDMQSQSPTLKGEWKLRAAGSGSAFTYQGRLTNSGANYAGPADFRFTIYDSASGGATVSPTFEQSGVAVTGGVFSLQIPADPSWFVNAPDRYLEVEVRTPADGATYTKLLPRQRIGQVPAAMVATTAQSVPWSGVTGVPAGVDQWNAVPGGISYQAGSVGIGTSSLNAVLTVAGGPSYNHLEVKSTFDQGTWFNLTNSAAGGRTWGLVSSGPANGEGAGAFLIRDNSVGAVRMAILPNGNVGIGTTSPQAKLDVQGAIAAGGPILFGNNLNDLLILNGSEGIPNFAIGIAPSTLRIHTALITQNISFGYGQASAYTQTAVISGLGNLTIIGNGFKPGGGSWAASSDPRLKHDIAPMKGTLDRLLSLRGYQFLYNDDVVRSNRGLPGVQIGLMADEVENVFPDWVSRDENGMRMVTERSTTALMVEALRDLRSEKDAQIESLRKENQLLKARLERIEKMLAPAGAEH